MTAYTPKEGPYIHRERLPEIQGYACLFDTAIVVGAKMLSFDRGAFELELIRRSDVKACLGHDGPTFASVRDGTLRLWEDEIGLAFSASIPRGQKFIFLPDLVAEGKTGVSIRFRTAKPDRYSERVATTDLDLIHLGLTTSPAFLTGAWLSNFTLMRNARPRLKALRLHWLDGQKPPATDIAHDYRHASGEAP